MRLTNVVSEWRKVRRGRANVHVSAWSVKVDAASVLPLDACIDKQPENSTPRSASPLTYHNTYFCNSELLTLLGTPHSC